MFYNRKKWPNDFMNLLLDIVVVTVIVIVVAILILIVIVDAIFVECARMYGCT